MNTPNTHFDEIRPYYDSELKEAAIELLQNMEFREVISNIAPHIDFDLLLKNADSFKTILDFQKAFVIPMIEMVKQKLCTGLTYSGVEHLCDNGIIMSNHRDIIMDPTFLCYVLVANNKNSCEIGIGDNLLKKRWIEQIVKANKCFIVKRDLSPRDMAKSFIELSAYINHTIKNNNHTVWIAQREGRSKDSNDRTQESILKMFALSSEGTYIERLKSLNICPLCISYEYDPCDFLKAKEFQQRRDNADYKKGAQDDLISMSTGIWGYKGHVHYAFTPVINEKLDAIEQTISNKKEQAAAICKLCDEQIFSAYKIYPVNIIALEMLSKIDSEKYKASQLTYTDEERIFVENYLNKQLAKIEIENKDEAFLRTKLLEMYANPLINHLEQTH